MTLRLFWNCFLVWMYKIMSYKPRHEISNSVLCATRKASDQPAHMCSLIRAFAGRCIFYECLATDWTSFCISKLKRRLHRLFWVYTCQNATLLEITCHGSYVFSLCATFHKVTTICTLLVVYPFQFMALLNSKIYGRLIIYNYWLLRHWTTCLMPQ